MTYLQLVQATWRILGHSDDEIADLNDNEGVKGDVISAVADAWLEIQRYRSRDWKFLRAIEHFDTETYKTDYAVGTDIFTGTAPSAASTAFAEWDLNMFIYEGRSLRFYNYDYFMTKFRDYDGMKLTFNSGSVQFTVGQTVTDLTSAATGVVAETATLSSGTYAGTDAVGYVYLVDIDGTFAVGNNVGNDGVTDHATITAIALPESGEPTAFTIDPANDSVLINSPDAVYSIHAHYKTAPQTLSSASDTPTNLPGQFHMAIVYKAIEDLAGPHFGAGELSQYYGRKYKQIIGEIMRSQNPSKAVRKRPIVK